MKKKSQQDPDMLPEYDFRDGARGEYAAYTDASPIEMSSEFQQLLERVKPRVEQLCRELAVDELRLFGSATSDAFDPASSDVDVVVDFRDHEAPGISDRYFSLAQGLEEVFERPVDLVTTRAIKNPYFRRIVDETGRLIYAA